MNVRKASFVTLEINDIMDVGSSPHLKWVTGNSVIITEIYFPSHRKDKEVAGPARQGMVQDPKRMQDAYQRLGKAKILTMENR